MARVQNGSITNTYITVSTVNTKPTNFVSHETVKTLTEPTLLLLSFITNVNIKKPFLCCYWYFCGYDYIYIVGVIVFLVVFLIIWLFLLSLLLLVLLLQVL